MENLDQENTITNNEPTNNPNDTMEQEQTNIKNEPTETVEEHETKDDKKNKIKKKQLKELETKQQELEAKVVEQNDKYLRLYSEFDNYRKRTIKEKLDLIKTASEEMIISILPVVDDFERAITLMESATDIDAVKEGEKLIFSKLKSILEQKGLQEMKCIGEPFNADLQEALSQIPAASDDLKGTVADVIEKGYYLNEKVIRYAKVIVAN